jgi:hypothetical protein
MPVPLTVKPLLTTFDVQADMTCKEVIWLCSNNSSGENSASIDSLMEVDHEHCWCRTFYSPVTDSSDVLCVIMERHAKTVLS